MFLQVVLVSIFLGYTCGDNLEARRDFVYNQDHSDVLVPNPSGGSQGKLRPSNSELSHTEFAAPNNSQTFKPECQLPPEVIPPENDIAKSTLWEILENTEEDLLIHNGDAVLLLGNTGSGKSTVMLTITGDLKNLTVYRTLGNSLIIVDAAQQIGITTASRTLVPNLVYDPPNNLYFYDCPGFLDNRDYKADITANYLMKKATENITSVRPVFIVPEDSVTQGGTKTDFGNLANSAVRMIKDLNKLQTGIGMIVTKVKNFDYEGEVRSDSVILNGIRQFLLQYKEDEEKKLNQTTSTFNNESNYFVRRKNIYSPGRLPNYIREQRAVDEKEAIRRRITFVEILLQAKKISFLRSPNKCGSFDKSRWSQDSRDKMTKLIRDDLKSVPVNKTDFGYALSGDTLMKVSELYKDLNRNVTDLMTQLVTNLRTSHLELTSAIKDLYQVKAWLDADYSNFTRIVQVLKPSKSPNEFGRKIYEAIVTRGYEQKWGLDLISQTRRIESYMDFFDSIAPEGVTYDRMRIEWLEPLESWVTEEVSARKEWYDFLYNLRNAFSYSQFQYIQQPSIPKDIRGIKASLGKDSNIVSDKIIQLYDQNMGGGSGFILTTDDSTILWEIVKEAFEVPQIECRGSTLTVKGSFVKVSQFTNSDGSFHLCGEFPPSQVVVLATRKVFFDGSVNAQKSIKSNKELGIIAPEWEVTQKVTLDLSGETGPNGGSHSYGQLKSMNSEDYNHFNELTFEEHTYNFGLSNMSRWIIPESEASVLRKKSFGFSNDDLPEHIRKKCETKDPPSKGKPGQVGAAGKHGGPGGNVIGLVGSIEHGDWIKVTVQGGHGGAGQAGGSGGEGEKGPELIFRQWRICDDSGPCDYHCSKDEGIHPCSKSGSAWPRHFDECYRNGSGRPICRASGCVGGKGGRGADGGAGGNGGLGGQGIIVTSDLSNITINSSRGFNGTDGLGGLGGLGGLRGNGATAQAMRTTTRSCPCMWTRQEDDIESSERSENGTNGVTGKNNLEQGPLLDPTITLTPQTLFLSYAEFLLSRDSLYFSNQEFFHSMSKKLQGAGNYTHIHLAQELLIIERANLFLKNQNTTRDTMLLLFIPKYQSYISRVDDYVQNRTLDDPQRKFCSLLYSMALNQARILQQAMGTPVVVDVANYLETVHMRLGNYAITEKSVVVEEERVRYTDTFSQKMTDAMEFIIWTVDPAIDQTFVEMAEVTEELLVAVEKMIEEAEQAVVDYKRAVERTKNKMVLQALFDSIKIGAAIVGLVGGPAAAAVGAVIGGAATIGEGITLANGTQIRPPTPLHQKIKKYAAMMEAKSKATSQERQEELDTLIGESRLAATENKELLGKLTPTVDQLEKDKKDLIQKGPSSSLKEFQDINKKVVGSEQALNTRLQETKEFIKKAQKGEAGTPEEQETAKKVGDRAITKVDMVKDAVNIVSTFGLQMYKNYRNNTKELARLMAMVKEAEEQVKDLNLFEKAVDDLLKPFTESVINDLDEAMKQMEGQNAVFLRVQQWKVQNVLRKYNFFLQDFSAAFPDVANQYAFLVEELQEAMKLMIDLYSFIEQYNEQMQFADYIANIYSPRGRAAKFGQAESAIFNKIDVALQASIILTDWDTCIQTFQQWVFPFSKEFQANLLTSDIPDYLSPTNACDVLTEVLPNIRLRVSNLQIAFQQYKSALFPVIDSELYFTPFNSELTSTIPFYIWRKELNKDKIRDLLSGQQVTLSAIPEFTFQRKMTAVKFTIAEIEPKAQNATIQQQLTEVFKKLKIQMTHSGVSKYIHEGTQFQMVGAKQAIHFNFERDAEGQRISPNQVYNKIKSGDVILSPYTLWTVQLFKASDDIEFEFKELEKFVGLVDLELIGKGSYVRNIVSTKSSVNLLRPFPLHYFRYRLSTLPHFGTNSQLQKLLLLS